LPGQRINAVSTANIAAPTTQTEIVMYRTLMAMFTLLLVAALSGCASGPSGKPELEDTQTFDGLVKVKKPAAGVAWMRPDLSLAGYTKIMLRNAGIEYRPVPRADRDKAFPLNEKQKARLQKTVGDAFRAELAKSTKFELVTEPGPDVLTIWGGLLDVVSFVPPEPMGRSDVYLRSIGEATLVLEIRDSESNATLVRILDRRAADSGQTFQMSNTVTNWSEVQHLARTWATTLRVRLDEAADWAR
jgi:Protein of unknown function (DUF3313)